MQIKADLGNIPVPEHYIFQGPSSCKIICQRLYAINMWLKPVINFPTYDMLYIHTHIVCIRKYILCLKIGPILAWPFNYCKTMSIILLIRCFFSFTQIMLHIYTHQPGMVGIRPPLIRPTSLTGRSSAVSSTTGDITPPAWLGQSEMCVSCHWFACHVSIPK